MARSHRFAAATAACVLGCASAPGGLGVEGRGLAPCPDKPNCVSSGAQEGSQRVESFFLVGPSDETWAQVVEAVAAMPATVVAVRATNYLRAEHTSRWMRFVDDLELLRTRDAQGGVRVDVRSASRVGYSDMGVNRARVEALRAELVRRGLVRVP